MVNKDFLKGKINAFYYPRKNKVTLPTIIMIEPTNLCNLKCAMCYVQQYRNGSSQLSLAEFQEIIGQFPKIRELIFCGIGEPLLNKDIFSMIALAKDKGISFINLITNGKLLDERIAEKIITSGVNRIQISIHSFNPEIFAKMRNEEKDSLEKLKLAIKSLITLKKELNSNIKVCCNAVITRFNYGDLSNFIKEAKDLCFDRVEFIQMTTANDNLTNINAPLDRMVGICKEARRLARSLNLEVGFLNGNEYGRCYQLWDFMMIHADGNISPCNGIFPTENIGIGNILNNSIVEIWYSEKYQRLREAVGHGRLKNCRYCESGYLMEGLNYMWVKNYYIRPLKRLLKYFLSRRRTLN